MTKLRVLVTGIDSEVTRLLRKRLPEEEFAVVGVEPGAEFVCAARAERPEIAVLDRVDERPDAARMELALLKNENPAVQVIVLSGRSSLRDATVIEGGVFYYLAHPSPEALIKVVLAAANDIEGRQAQ